MSKMSDGRVVRSAVEERELRDSLWSEVEASLRGAASAPAEQKPSFDHLSDDEMFEMLPEGLKGASR